MLHRRRFAEIVSHSALGQRTFANDPGKTGLKWHRKVSNKLISFNFNRFFGSLNPATLGDPRHLPRALEAFQVGVAAPAMGAT